MPYALDSRILPPHDEPRCVTKCLQVLEDNLACSKARLTLAGVKDCSLRAEEGMLDAVLLQTMAE